MTAMNIVRSFARLAATFVLTVVATAQETAARKPGSVFRSEIDALIARLSVDAKARAGGAGWAPLGGESVLATAQILCAMGHCHRFYHVSDGPLLRPSLAQLIAARDANGSFVDVATTTMVADAFAAVDPTGRKDDIARARRSLGDVALDGFAGMVEAVVAKSAPGMFPQDVGAAAAKRAKELGKAGAGFAPAEAAGVLLHLVVCQCANRRLDEHDAAATSPAQDRGFAWLLGKQKGGQFGGGGARGLPLTGFGLMALQTKPSSARSAEERAAIEDGCRSLLGMQNEDGSFGESLQNYTTCVVVGALKRWGDAAAGPALAKAQRALLAFQNVERGGYDRSDRDYGSIGYGGSQRGDLSNLQFALQGLVDTGLPAADEAFAKAIVFLQRTQNLRSHNDWSGEVADPEANGAIVVARPGDDGGAMYYPGNSSAGYVARPDGSVEPRSYGSMTYALLKAYTLAGVPASDTRVRAAVEWIRANWTLEHNPGVDPAAGDRARFQGLFYYYLLMAQALDTMHVATVDVGDRPVDWRKALRRQLESMQAADGSWTNGANGRWMEGDPMLCTCYALLALERCR
ncbi:MAG: terpene cyclase/mutase family protein [Planctomycetes bacterium]|nr:terpene cyclase/mutase family protein [Planctomycetota bacterium]